MERRYEIRKREMLQDTEIKPQVTEGMLKRLEQFAQPFVAAFSRRDSRVNVWIYLGGLLSDAAPGWHRRLIERKSKRREMARFYHYKRHKLLAPLRVQERK